MKMVLVDCEVQNGSADIVAECEITNNLCTKGILTRVDISQLPSESVAELNSLRASNDNTSRKLVKSITLPSLSTFRSKSYILSSDLIQEINSNHSRTSLKSAKLSPQTPRRLENSETNCYIIRVPSTKRNKISFKTDTVSLFEENPSFLKLLTHQITLRKWVSEPVMFGKENKENTYQKHFEKRFVDIPMLKPPEMEMNKLTSGLTNGKSRSRNVTKNVQIVAPVTNPKPSRITRPSVFESRRKKTKTTQGTQVESRTTKEVESQTDFKKDILGANRSLRRKQETSSTSEKDTNKPAKKTVIIPFSFMDRCQAYLERKHQRAMSEKRYELKRWARPPLILQKKPHEVVIPQSKLTIPQSVSFETDRRREKWEKYMMEFQQRQEKLKQEKQSVKQSELRKFRNTLIPKIHKVPYKKLGIKPKKPITSPFKKLREQSKEYKKKQIKSKYMINNKKPNNENNKTNDCTKSNKKYAKINKSNSKQSKQKSMKTKMYNKNINSSVNHKMTININEKKNLNIKNLPSSPNRNTSNMKIKISLPNRNNEVRRNYCSK